MPRSLSNIVWDNKLVHISGGYEKATVLDAVLTPVGKQNYRAEGLIKKVSCPAFEGKTMCATLEMWVFNETGFGRWQSEQMPPTGVFGWVRIPPTLGKSIDFVFQNFDYNGQYHFIFFAVDNQHLLEMVGQHIEAGISLTETWTEP